MKTIYALIVLLMFQTGARAGIIEIPGIEDQAEQHILDVLGNAPSFVRLSQIERRRALFQASQFFSAMYCREPVRDYSFSVETHSTAGTVLPWTEARLMIVGLLLEQSYGYHRDTPACRLAGRIAKLARGVVH